MSSGFTITLPNRTRGPAVNRTIELDDITSESFKHFMNHSGIKPQFGTIKIKSYYQKTLMQSMFNLLGSFSRGWGTGEDAAELKDKSKLEAAKMAVKEVIIGISQPGAFQHISEMLLYGIDVVDGDPALNGLPFILMKGLFATEAGSTLTLPFPVLGTNSLMMSDGSYGWGQGNSMYSPFGHSTGLVGHVLRTLAINVTPMFSPGKGGGTTQKLTLSFDLMNDTLEKFERHNYKIIKEFKFILK